jgi:hypothetical protein
LKSKVCWVVNISKITILWNVMPCSLIGKYHTIASEEHTVSIFMNKRVSSLFFNLRIATRGAIVPALDDRL